MSLVRGGDSQSQDESLTEDFAIDLSQGHRKHKGFFIGETGVDIHFLLLFLCRTETRFRGTAVSLVENQLFHFDNESLLSTTLVPSTGLEESQADESPIISQSVSGALESCVSITSTIAQMINITITISH